jgi:hypothetical protein
MRLESFLIGVAILGFGVFLVASHGTVAGVNLLGLIGLNCGSAVNTTNPDCFALSGLGVGTVVAIFGLGMIANGLRAPSTPRMPGLAGLRGGSDEGAMYGGAALPPQMMEMMRQAALAHRTVVAGVPMGSGPAPGLRYCSRCGRGNFQDAQFCQQCGSPMPIPPLRPTGPTAASPTPDPPAHADPGTGGVSSGP